MNRIKPNLSASERVSSKTGFLSKPIGIGLMIAVALGLVVVSVSAINLREAAPGVEQQTDIAWRSSPMDVGALQDRAPEEFVYIELIEENSDTFEEPLFVANRVMLPAPFTFEDGVLKVDAQLVKVSNEDLRLFIESGESHDRVIFLAHWNFYTGVGRNWEDVTYYILNEPSGSIPLPYFSSGDAIHYTPFDSLLKTLEVRMPGTSFSIQDAAQDGSVQFALDDQTVRPRAAENSLLGTKTYKTVVTELTPYDNTVDFGEITFTTKVTLYNYGSPTAVEFIDTDAGKGEK